MDTIDEVKAKLNEMARDCVASTIEEVLCRDSELAEVYNKEDIKDLPLEMGSDNELVRLVIKRRLNGDPEPWLTADDCIEFLSNEEFDTEDHMHTAETDGQITVIRRLMYGLGMDKEGNEIGNWLYN